MTTLHRFTACLPLLFCSIICLDCMAQSDSDDFFYSFAKDDLQVTKNSPTDMGAIFLYRDAASAIHDGLSLHVRFPTSVINVTGLELFDSTQQYLLRSPALRIFAPIDTSNLNTLGTVLTSPSVADSTPLRLVNFNPRTEKIDNRDPFELARFRIELQNSSNDAPAANGWRSNGVFGQQLDGANIRILNQQQFSPLIEAR